MIIRRDAASDLSLDCFTRLVSSSPYDQGPVVQSVVSLTSSLVVKMLTVLVRIISNSHELLLKKMWVAFANAKVTHIFSAKILVYAIFDDQNFNDTLTNDIVNFEQLGLEKLYSWFCFWKQCPGIAQTKYLSGQGLMAFPFFFFFFFFFFFCQDSPPRVSYYS